MSSLSIVLMLLGVVVMYLGYIWYGYAVFVVGSLLWLRRMLRRGKYSESPHVPER